MKNIFIILIALLFITSCSIEKRRYRAGYHVDWNLPTIQKRASIKKKSIPKEELADVGTDTKLNSGHQLALAESVVEERPDSILLVKSAKNQINDTDITSTTPINYPIAKADNNVIGSEEASVNRMNKLSLGAGKIFRAKYAGRTVGDDRSYRAYCIFSELTKAFVWMSIVIWPLFILAAFFFIILVIWWLALGAPVSACSCCCDNYGRRESRKPKRRKKRNKRRGLY